MVAIRTESLSKDYAAGPPWRRTPVRALERVSLEVREGEIFGFLGPNGAGKSTLIRLLLGFLHPTGGRATVLGLDVGRDSVAIRSRSGYLPGGVALYDTLTGEELLDHLGALTGRPSSLRPALCDALELPAATLGRRVRDYSRGMRQKLGIVQALQHDPELAILDEPSEGLDPLMQLAFYGILAERRAAGRTIFFSSHVLSEVERVCDRVAIVRAGRLVATENVDAIRRLRRRNVELQLAGSPPHLDGIAGVSDVALAGDRLTCRLEGDVGPFLDALHGTAVVDLLIEPAHLEEAFLELYGDGAGAPAGRRAGTARGDAGGSAP